MRRGARWRLAALAVAAALPGAARAADYRFDLSEIEPRPYQVSGFAEARGEHLRLRPEGALFPLSFAGESPRPRLDRANLGFELAGRWRQGMLTAHGRLGGSASVDAFGSDGNATVLEAAVRLSPAEGLSVDLGKQVQRWGKGYAWNPVAFFERPKDPNDPQLAREGFVMASTDWVKSLPGTLAAVGFTPVLLPVDDGLNRDFGAPRHANPGARLYLLLADTDIDLLWAAKGSRPRRIGLDFSRNFGTQLELHGEWARSFDATLRTLDGAGVAGTRIADADSWLLGLRYLSEREVTWIAEIYRNGGGQSEGSLGAFHELLRRAWGPAGTAALRSQAQALAQAGFARNNPGRRYAYLRVAAKDPFDWLYLTPALTAIVNLDDRSHQLTPEVAYTGWQDLELRARAVLLHGRAGSEFGEKAVARRFELSVKLFF
ncbi:MAG: hypothetical protein KF683_07445 [Rubrivivax sp.]|nr:hypothetical protein [Rubrivivax sp.]